MAKCPFIKSVGYGDESTDLCRESEKPSGRIHPCWLVSGETCDIWEEIKKEWEQEAILE